MTILIFDVVNDVAKAQHVERDTALGAKIAGC